MAQTLARAFVQLGYRAVRFNFRGVGASEGEYDEGRGETDDTLAVIAAHRDSAERPVSARTAARISASPTFPPAAVPACPRRCSVRTAACSVSAPGSC